MSLYAKLVAGVVLLLALIAAGWKIHHGIYKSGYDAAMQEVSAKAEADRVKRQDGIDTVASTFVAKTVKQRVVVKSNQEKVTTYVPPTDCPLSPGFRLLYDANATGQEVDDTARDNATAVTAQDVARTTGENFGICRYDQARLVVCQAIVKALNGE